MRKRKKISIIAAIGKNFEIGKDNDMPWGRDLPGDLANFRKLTLGASVIMGIKTFQSLNGKPLPKRENIVLSEKLIEDKGVIWARDLNEAYQKSTNEKIFVIGGGLTYKLAMTDASFLYITEVDQSFPDCTVFFPKIDRKIWREVSRKSFKADQNNKYNYSFVIFKRIEKN